MSWWSALNKNFRKPLTAELSFPPLLVDENDEEFSYLFSVLHLHRSTRYCNIPASHHEDSIPTSLISTMFFLWWTDSTSSWLSKGIYANGFREGMCSTRKHPWRVKEFQELMQFDYTAPLFTILGCFENISLFTDGDQQLMSKNSYKALGVLRGEWILLFGGHLEFTVSPTGPGTEPCTPSHSRWGLPWGLPKRLWWLQGDVLAMTHVAFLVERRRNVEVAVPTSTGMMKHHIELIQVYTSCDVPLQEGKPPQGVGV